MKEAVRKLLRVKQEIFMPLVHRVGEAPVDFGYALAKVSLEECIRNVGALSRMAKDLSEHPRAQRTNGQFKTENLIRSVLKME